MVTHRGFVKRIRALWVMFNDEKVILFFIDFSYILIQIFCDIRFKFYEKEFDLKAYVTPRDFQVCLT